jgi:hypothetical protein
MGALQKTSNLILEALSGGLSRFGSPSQVALTFPCFGLKFGIKCGEVIVKQLKENELQIEEQDDKMNKKRRVVRK